MKAEVRVGYQRTEEVRIYDYKNIPPRTNKVETVGKFRKKTFLIECDGQGHLKFIEVKSQLKLIEELSKLRDKGFITTEEFEQKKKNLLDQL